ncbi:MAG TPA: hypothetical protein VK816_09165 [Jatrophihabitantaceae bacterium]|jgi:hypothetical protein|nr:hypothetical protein [Jatrophihabitantaceae bacterium]
MAKSGPTPIEFTAKLYYVAGGIAAIIVVVSVVAGLSAGSAFGFVSAAFWAVVSFLAFRAGRAAPR